MPETKEDFASEVAKHYNEVEQQPIKERSKSDIYELRKFNNAMKSLLQNQAFEYASNNFGDPTEQFRVLDLGCGKGGDLPKYLRKPRVGLIVGVDVADKSIEQCQERFTDLRKQLRSNGPEIRGSFFVADLTRVDIEKKLQELKFTEKFHVASSQFSLHYSFESYEQALKYIGNASRNLAKRGIFFGTYPDGPKLLKLARMNDPPGEFVVGEVMSVKFPPESLSNPQPFGTKYHFKLQDLVDCPEFLVHPRILDKLLTQLGFIKVFDKSFEDSIRDATSAQANNSRQMKEVFHVHKALRFDLDRKKAILDEEFWKAASVYRCFCYVKVK